MSWCYHYVQFIRAVAKSCPSSADRSEDLYLSMDTWISYNAERKKKKNKTSIGLDARWHIHLCARLCVWKMSISFLSLYKYLTKSYSNSKAQKKCHDCYKILLCAK